MNPPQTLYVLKNQKMDYSYFLQNKEESKVSSQIDLIETEAESTSNFQLKVQETPQLTIEIKNETTNRKRSATLLPDEIKNLTRKKVFKSAKLSETSQTPTIMKITSELENSSSVSLIDEPTI